MSGLLYVCSPYSGEVGRNKEYARQLTRTALDNGFLPVTVHLYITEALDDTDPEERKTGLAAGLAILEQCKYVLLGDKYGISSGMQKELAFATLKGKILLFEKDGELYLQRTEEKYREWEKKQWEK